MAIHKMFSFDYSTDPLIQGIEQTSGGANVSISGTARTGAHSLWLGNVTYFGSGMVRVPFNNSVTTAWAQCAYYINTTDYGTSSVANANASGAIFTFAGDKCHIKVGYDYATRQIQVGRGTSSTPSNFTCSVIANSLAYGLFPQYSWIFIEAYVVLHDTTGRVIVKINGEKHIDFSGDTNNGGSYIDSVHMGSYANDVLYDDLIIGDGSGSDNIIPPGDARVEYISPNAAGEWTEFTPSAGSNYQNVSETTPNDSTYNSSMEVGAKDLFGMGNLGGNGVIHAVQSVLRVKKDDAGTRFISPLYRKAIGVGDTPRIYAGDKKPVSSSYAYAKALTERSPDTGLAWGIDEVNDLEFGYIIAGSETTPASFFSLDAELD